MISWTILMGQYTCTHINHYFNKPGNWAVMYVCYGCRFFFGFYNFSIRCWTVWYFFPFIIHFNDLYLLKGCRGRNHVVVGFTTTYVINAYHHLCWEFESRSGRGVYHYVIKFVSDLRQVGGFLRVLRFPPKKNWPQRYIWNIVESG
jgi:hypothetical protein